MPALFGLSDCPRRFFPSQMSIDVLPLRAALTWALRSFMLQVSVPFSIARFTLLPLFLAYSVLVETPRTAVISSMVAPLEISDAIHSSPCSVKSYDALPPVGLPFDLDLRMQILCFPFSSLIMT